ncbi:phage protease [Sphingobium rhizovicinum]|uniref:Phage protease n=1 Tax=Sphingobium rhizovicinum TaxID=432308 RepID=A0ABV7NK60_9SPHN
MSKPLPQIALCSVSIAPSDEAPEWLHLCPVGEILTEDGRGPYRASDLVALMAASIRPGKFVLDECHSTDLAAPRGEEAPARAWIIDLQQREDGIWGKPEWTPAAIERRIWKEYRGISPVIAHRADGTITQILRASLVNAPNFTGLKTLHQQEGDTHMDFRAKLLEALGLGSDADDAAIMDAIKAKLEAKPDAEMTALQSAIGSIATAIGLTATADAASVVTGVQKLKAGEGADARIVALQSEVGTLTTALNDLRGDNAKKAATAFVDGAIAAGRVGLKPVRDEYIAMHQENPTRAEKLINGMPVLKAGAQLGITPGAVEADAAEDPTQIAMHAATYQKKQAEAGHTISIAAAVRAVQEGKHK